MKPPARNESSPTPLVKKKYSIVYADDHALIRQAITLQINLLTDFEVIQQCKDGLEAKQFLQHHPMPDILITDLDMPGMNGYDIIEWVKNHFPEIKILVLTMFDTIAAREIAHNCGADAFASKAMEMTEIEKALYGLLDTKKYTKPNGLFLSNKEIEFLEYLCTGLSFAEIARSMYVSQSTAEKMRENLLARFAIDTRASLARYALENGIVLPQRSNTAKQKRPLL